VSGNETYRCAIYTRKSTEDGLEQDFNSLDAQREACEAYIASQASLGWRVIRTRYDDGGISGGTMNRPALLRLLKDIEARRVDVVVVYKIDRLTRSLMDFARIVDVFDGHAVSFVSVTQQFNTTTSMGRLTLNVLLSFAQFEREVTAERIRDKIAASKKKGMWMGGPPPLGYDVRDKQLVANEAEAETVRQLFRLYLETGGVRRLKERADQLGITTKYRRLLDGRTQGGKLFSRGNLYHLLANPIYIGEIKHHEKTYPGKHDAIIDKETWNAVQDMMASNAVDRHSATNSIAPSILAGLIFDETGDRLSPSHAIKDGIRYRYYVSHRLMQARRKGADGWRLPASEIERPVVNIINQHLADELKLARLLDLNRHSAQLHQSAFSRADRLSRQLRTALPNEQKRLLLGVLHRIELHPNKLIIKIDATKLESLLGTEPMGAAGTDQPKRIQRIEVPHKLRKRGVETKLVIGAGEMRQPNPDHHLIMAVAKAHRWLNELTSGRLKSISELAEHENEDRNEISRFLPLAFLAPDIVETIIMGRQPVDLTVERLRRISSLPYSWKEQLEFLGFAR